MLPRFGGRGILAITIAIIEMANAARLPLTLSDASLIKRSTTQTFCNPDSFVRMHLTEAEAEADAWLDAGTGGGRDIQIGQPQQWIHGPVKVYVNNKDPNQEAYITKSDFDSYQSQVDTECGETVSGWVIVTCQYYNLQVGRGLVSGSDY